MSSSLLHTAISNLQLANPSAPNSPSGKSAFSQSSTSTSPDPNPDAPAEPLDDSGDEDDDQVVDVATRPTTPVFGKTPSALGRARSAAVPNPRDPLKALPTALVVRIFIQLDIRSLARCDRVCKRWRKSSTLNYVWFLHTRSLTLPKPAPSSTRQRDDPDSFDPYDKPSLLSTHTTPLPTSATPQWSKRESKSQWKTTFGLLATRKPTDLEPGSHLQVDMDALIASASGSSTPGGGGHAYAGLGSGAAASDRWSSASVDGSASGASTPPKSKKEMREAYKSLGGRKSRGKSKFGETKDREGMGNSSIADAPW